MGGTNPRTGQTALRYDERLNMLQKLKNSWKSRTVWAGTILLVLSAIQTNMIDLTAVMDPKTYGLVTFVLSMVIIALRFVTSKPLDEK